MIGLEPFFQKYGISDTQDIANIHGFFSDPETEAVLSKAEKERIIGIVLSLLVLGLVSAGIIVYSALWNSTVVVNGVRRPSEWWDGLLPLCMITPLMLKFARSLVRKKIRKTLHGIFRSLASKIPGVEYSTGSEYAFPVDGLVSEKFLSSYDRIETKEDSIRFSITDSWRKMDVSGFEFVTSKLVWQKKKSRQITNRCYLVRADFPEARFNIEKSVLIVRDLADSWVVNFLAFMVPAILVLPFLMARNAKGGTMTIIDGRAVQTVASYNPLSDHPIWALALAAWIGLISLWIVRYAVNWRRQKMENVEFEKLFDVKCEDPILARKVLTPAIMDRIVQFVSKTNGRYGFLFRGKSVFLKKMLSRQWILEVGLFRNIRTNPQTFIQWYSELKEIIALVNDTGVIVFSKTTTEDPVRIPLSEEVGSGMSESLGPS